MPPIDAPYIILPINPNIVYKLSIVNPMENNIKALNDNTGAIKNLISSNNKLIAAINATIVSPGVPSKISRGGPIHFAKGGVVPGRGNKDSVPARLAEEEPAQDDSDLPVLGQEEKSKANWGFHAEIQGLKT